MILFFILLFAQNSNLLAQTMPEVMEKGSLEEQKDYLTERMNIYNGYRAVRDDIFLKMLKNGLDSLNNAKNQISGLNELVGQKDSEIKDLNSKLEKTKENLDEAVENRDSLTFIGIPMAKTLYNVILWGIIVGLVAVLVIIGLWLKRNRIIMHQTRKDLEDTKEDFEAFRKSAREKSEQMVINHFNEIKKLKEGRS